MEHYWMRKGNRRRLVMDGATIEFFRYYHYEPLYVTEKWNNPYSKDDNGWIKMSRSPTKWLNNQCKGSGLQVFIAVKKKIKYTNWYADPPVELEQEMATNLVAVLKPEQCNGIWQ